ncbi:MAG: non-reducing end alpha-L-arabinofuranosidase family hydrolase [Tepidisphaerales bacterium]
MLLLLILVVAARGAAAQGVPDLPDRVSKPESDYTYSSYWDPVVLNLLRGNFSWTLGGPLLAAGQDDPDTVSLRQPTTVQFQGRWHLFLVSGKPGRPRRIEYVAGEKLETLQEATRTVVDLGKGDVSCPQVFYFQPAKRWFLFFQSFDATRRPAVRPMFSTNEDIGNPRSWTPPKEIQIPYPQFDALWRDFWVICDDEDAYLFYTTTDGRVYRCRGALGSFPEKWKPPLRALKGDFVSSAHVYRVKKLRRYLLVVEAADLHRRYIKAYINSRLDAGWDDLCASLNKPMAGAANVRLATPATPHWTDSLAEPELIRDGFDQTQTIDPKSFRMIFSGCTETDRAGKGPGEIAWKIGIIQQPQKGLMDQFRN